MTGNRGIGALLAAALVGGVVGAGAAGWLAGQRGRATRDRDGARIAALAAERDDLARRLAEQAAAAAALAAERDRLAAAVAAAEPAGGDPLAAREAPPIAESAPAAAIAPPPSAGVQGAPGAVAGPLPFDPAPVLAAGFSPEEVARFRARLDELELERLYLRDRAAREGWLDTPRFREQSDALGRAFLGLRDEFDEGLYDWVLYATGHPNRVAVTEVLSGSAAEAAGLRGGDVIVRYDQRLVLSPGELRDATAAGRAGELVAVEVQRRGDPAPLRVFVPRGPLGVRMVPARVEPPPAG
jgi:hypothetical protein